MGREVRQEIRIIPGKLSEDSDVIGEALVAIGPVEVRLNIANGIDGAPRVRWPRKKLANGNKCFVARMLTQQASLQIEAEIISAWHKAIR